MNRINITLIKVLFVCLVLSVTVQCCAATTVSIGDITADPGEIVTVPIRIDGIEDYGTATIKLEYDTAVVSVEDAKSSSDSTIAAKDIYNPNPEQAETEGTEGYALISAWNLNGVSGDIVFADVRIKAADNSGGSTTLTLTVDTLQDISYNEIPVDLISGSFTITGQASADPTPTQVPSTPSANGGGASTSQTPHDDGTETSPTSPPSDIATHPESHDAETDVNSPTPPVGEAEVPPTSQPAATSTPKKPASSMPGFGGALLASGLLTAYLIVRPRSGK